MRGGEGRDPDGQPGAQQMVERPDGGILAGVVGVKTHHHLLDVAFKDAGMVRRKGGALGGDDILDARHVTGNQVKLALAHNRAIGFQQGAFGLVQAEENLALGKNRGFRGVDVFGGLFVTGEDPPAKPHYAPLIVTDGEHQPAPKTVIVAVGSFLANDQAGGFRQSQVVAFAPRPIDGVVPGLGGGAEAEEFAGLRRDTAFFEVSPGHLACRFARQGALPALGDLFVDLQQPILEVPSLLLRGILVVLQRNVRPLGQAADGLWEIQVLEVLDKPEHIATLMTAETMEDLAVWINVKAWALLPVEGAKRHEIGARSLERQVGADHIHDVTRGADLLEVFLGKHASHSSVHSGGHAAFGQ